MTPTSQQIARALHCADNHGGPCACGTDGVPMRDFLAAAYRTVLSDLKRKDEEIEGLKDKLRTALNGVSQNYPARGG